MPLAVCHLRTRTLRELNFILNIRGSRDRYPGVQSHWVDWCRLQSDWSGCREWKNVEHHHHYHAIEPADLLLADSHHRWRLQACESGTLHVYSECDWWCCRRHRYQRGVQGLDCSRCGGSTRGCACLSSCVRELMKKRRWRGYSLNCIASYDIHFLNVTLQDPLPSLFLIHAYNLLNHRHQRDRLQRTILIRKMLKSLPG